MLNAYIDDLADKFTYQQLEDSIPHIVHRFESIFGVDGEMEDLMEGNKPEKLTSTEWYYAIVDAGNVSDTTALIKSANMIADRLSNLEDAYLVNSELDFDGEIDDHWPGWNDDVTGTVTVKVSYNATYTMYVHQVNVTKAGDTDVPVTVAVLKVEPSQKV